MKRRLLSVVLLTLWGCAGFAVAEDRQNSAAKSIVIFDGQLLKGWNTGSWGNVKLHVQPLKGTKSNILLLECGESAKNWAGAFLSTSQPTGKTKAEIVLDQAIKKSGVLVLSINGSEDEWGNHIGHQKLKIRLGQRTGQGKWSHGSGYLPFKFYIKGGNIDNDPDTWQEVRIPLSKLLSKVDMAAIGSLFVQYMGTPTGSVAIRSIYIEP